MPAGSLWLWPVDAPPGQIRSGDPQGLTGAHTRPGWVPRCLLAAQWERHRWRRRPGGRDHSQRRAAPGWAEGLRPQKQPSPSATGSVPAVAITYKGLGEQEPR